MGRCSSGGAGGGGKIVQFQPSTAKGWAFPGYKNALDNIEEKAKKTNSERVVLSLYRSLQGLDRAITADLNENNPLNDRGALLTHRRRTRKLLKRLADGDFSKR